MTDKFPKYVKLSKYSPYKDGRVVCNGICITTEKPVFIVNKTMFKKLSLIEKYLEEVENV